MVIQSVILDRDLYTLSAARKFLRDHGFKGLDQDLKEHVRRFRQFKPDNSQRYFTKQIAPGIKYVFMVPMSYPRPQARKSKPIKSVKKKKSSTKGPIKYAIA